MPPTAETFHILATGRRKGGTQQESFPTEDIKTKVLPTRSTPKTTCHWFECATSQSRRASPTFNAPFILIALHKAQADSTQDECPHPRFHVTKHPSVATSRGCSPQYLDQFRVSTKHHSHRRLGHSLVLLPGYPSSLLRTIAHLDFGPEHSHGFVLLSHWSDYTPRSPAGLVLRVHRCPFHSHSPVSCILSDAYRRPFPPIPAAVRLLLRPFSGSSLRL